MPYNECVACGARKYISSESMRVKNFVCKPCKRAHEENEPSEEEMAMLY